MCSEDWYPLVLQTAISSRCLSYTHTHTLPMLQLTDFTALFLLAHSVSFEQRSWCGTHAIEEREIGSKATYTYFVHAVTV